MKSLTFVIILLLITPGSGVASPQSRQAEQKSPSLAGDIERAGTQFSLVLTNLSDAREFRGSVSIGLGPPADAPLRFTIALAPGETRRLSLHNVTPASDQYSLMIYDLTGALALYRIAQIKPAAGTETEAAPKQVTAPKKDSTGVRVSARLTRGIESGDAELPTPDKVEPFLLTFEIESAAPIKGANFALTGKDFQRRQPVTVQGRTSLEFKLPDTLRERKLTYTLAAGASPPLARGEIDLDQLIASGAVSINALTFDQTVYSPGESARAVIELLGDASRGYRLEVTAKDGAERVLFKDVRRGTTTPGTSRQEFSIELPREVKGPVTLAFQVFGSQTNQLFDSGVREVPLSGGQAEKPKDGKGISP